MNRRERRAQWQAAHRAASLAPAADRARAPGIAPRAHAASAHSAINLRIGELVLRGFEKRHASRIAAAFEHGLVERLRTGAVPDALRRRMASSLLRLAPVALRRSHDPVAIGEQLAASVFAFERESRGGSR
jgi:hypothetical protein